MQTNTEPIASATSAPDEEAIRAVLGGDRASFAVLVRRHNQVLYRACRAILHDDAEAEDAVQTAWVSAYRALASFRRDASFRTWLTRIAVNEASSRLRRRQRLAAVPMENADMPSRTDLEHDALSAELGRILERHIDALPEGLRAVVVLRDVIELDTAETAECLGIGQEAVRVRLHRARHALAAALTESMGAVLENAAPAVWRFDGDRCSRVLAHVMAAIAA